MTEQQNRVVEFQRSLGISMRSFEGTLGLSGGTFVRAKSLSKNMISLLKERYPILNMEWVLTGVGNMLNENPYGVNIDMDLSSGKHIQSPHTEIKGDASALAHMQAKIDALEEKCRSLEADKERLMLLLEKLASK